MPPTAETKLVDLGFQLILPSQLLQPYVRSYWYFRRETPLLAYREEYMHPTGGFGMVFNLGGALHLDAQAITQPIFLDGANTVSRKMGFSGRVEVLGVRFREGGAYPFLGMPLSELRNEIAFLDAVKSSGLAELQARLQETAAPSDRITLLEEWLLGRLLLGKERHAIIPASLTLLRRAHGQLLVPDLADKLAVSQRHLERLYQSQVGMSPKQYALLQRVEMARLALKQLNGQTTADVAADLGYFDQAHFIHEFSAVIGVTPYAYLKRAAPRRK